MSIQSEINRIKANVLDSYAAVAGKGGEIPAVQDSSSLAAAIGGIPVGVTEEQLREALLAKQDVLTGQPGQVVGFSPDSTAQAMPGWSNPNLLVNWYFADPINQRGQAEYIKAGYTIDRWRKTTGESGVVGITGDGLTIVSGAPYLRYIVESEMREWLTGKEVTFSAMSANGTFNSITTVMTETTVFVAQYAGTVTYGTVSSTYPNQIVGISAVDSAVGDSLVAVKFELGPIQTLARQDADGNWVLNDPPPDKALELAKCQRYYQVFTSSKLLPTKAVDFRPSMRVNPSMGTIEIDGVTYYTADANL